VREAPDFDDRAVREEVVVDGVDVGDEVALVAGEQLVDAGAVMPRRVAEEHVQRGRDEHPEVPGAALLLRLDEDAGGIGAAVGLAEGVRAHRLDDRPRERGELRVPAADRRARELDAVARVDPFEPMERQRLHRTARPAERAVGPVVQTTA
jgi:hypothetical protein